jgi:hypothetical protein
MNLASSIDFVIDELFELQLRIARRADDIARSRSVRSSLNLECWLLAEQEFIGHRRVLRTANEAAVLAGVRDLI